MDNVGEQRGAVEGNEQGLKRDRLTEQVAQQIVMMLCDWGDGPKPQTSNELFKIVQGIMEEQSADHTAYPADQIIGLLIADGFQRIDWDYCLNLVWKNGCWTE